MPVKPVDNTRGDIAPQGGAAPQASRVVALSTLRTGQEAVLQQDNVSEEDSGLLRAMGLRPNCRLVLCRAGEPCIVRVLGGHGCSCRIGLARRLADRVLVGIAGE